MDIEKEMDAFIKQELAINPYMSERSIRDLRLGFVNGAKVALVYARELSKQEVMA